MTKLICIFFNKILFQTPTELDRYFSSSWKTIELLLLNSRYKVTTFCKSFSCHCSNNWASIREEKVVVLTMNAKSTDHIYSAFRIQPYHSNHAMWVTLWNKSGLLQRRFPFTEARTLAQRILRSKHDQPYGRYSHQTSLTVSASAVWYGRYYEGRDSGLAFTVLGAAVVARAIHVGCDLSCRRPASISWLSRMVAANRGHVSQNL